MINGIDISNLYFSSDFNETFNGFRENIYKVLFEIGVRVHNFKALELFNDFGAKVNFKEKKVRLNENLLIKALGSLPNNFTLHGKDKNFDLDIKDKKYYTIGGGPALNIYKGNKFYKPSIDDLIELTALQNMLEYPQIMNTVVNPIEIIDSKFLAIELFAIVYPRTKKPFFAQAYSTDDVKKLIKIYEIIHEENNYRDKIDFAITVCLISPLTHSKEAGEVLIECAKNDIPLFINVSPIAGATSPISVEGTIVEKFANFLVALTLVQLINPGNPCIFGSASSIFDLLKGYYISFSPIQYYNHKLSSKISKLLGFPYQNSLIVDSKIPDGQYAIERCLGIMFSLLSEVNFSNLQNLGSMTISSKEHIVIDNEILKNINNFIKGTSLDLAKTHKKFEGFDKDFLLEDGNVDYFKNNVWFSEFFNYENLDNWKKNRESMIDKVTGYKVKNLLKNYKLNKTIISKINKVVNSELFLNTSNKIYL